MGIMVGETEQWPARGRAGARGAVLRACRSKQRLTDCFVGDRMAGYVLHLLGEQGPARLRIERMVAHYVAPSTGPRIVRFIFDQRATARSFLARILWLQGFPDQAAAAAQTSIDEAKAANDMLTVCQVLVQAACPISILAGDYRRLELFVAMLLDYSSRNALGFWRVLGPLFQRRAVDKERPARRRVD